MKTLKIANEALHTRFKSLCAQHRISMLDAVDAMVRSWCEEVENENPALSELEYSPARPIDERTPDPQRMTRKKRSRHTPSLSM